MNTESTTRTAISFLAIVLVASLVAAALGGAFGALVAAISPEFVTELFRPEADQGLVRYAFVVGMIWGLFIGVAVSCFGCFLAAVIKILRIRFEYRKNREAGH